MTYNGPSSGVSKTIEIDVGYGNQNKDVISVEIVDPDILATSVIVAVQSGEGATGKSHDENEFDHFIINAHPSSTGGNMTLILRPLSNVTLTGKYMINYVIG